MIYAWELLTQLTQICASIMNKLPFFILFSALAACLLPLSPQPVGAFPPAPYYTLYGMVRDQVGQALAGDGIVLLLLKNGQEVARTPVASGALIDQSYELNIRLDMARAGTLLYDPAAIASNSVYSLSVLMNGQTFYPIEVSNNLTAGKGGERVRLDLNLGVDSDGDGIPDIWEEWQLWQAGYQPNGNGVWPINLITRNGDLDGDGLSNWMEYIAGTFAGDPTEKLTLEIKEKLPGKVRLEFYSIAGKFYTIERSTDLVTWERVDFRPVADTESPINLYKATDIGVMSAFTVPVAVNEFYRLTVR
jgi:hypothetical protein